MDEACAGYELRRGLPVTPFSQRACNVAITVGRRGADGIPAAQNNSRPMTAAGGTAGDGSQQVSVVVVSVKAPAAHQQVTLTVEMQPFTEATIG